MGRKATGDKKAAANTNAARTSVGLNATNEAVTTNQKDDFDEDFDDDDQRTQIIDDIYMPPPPVRPNLSGDQTGKRLIIETIEITNFKSYGGTTILGPFHKSFNSIVGPNGSGKSNVIDSMLFVFGYRAQKLRSNKLSTLIHNSDTMPNCQFARVKVNFAMLDDKGGTDRIILPDTQFSISRVVEKVNNNSYYEISDLGRVKFREVSKKLQDFGIDLRYSRFLILQGEVEQISLMKPKAENPNDTGMLEFLEDIIGTSRYKEPIEKLNVKRDELSKESLTYINRVKNSQKEYNSTAEAMNEAINALKLENQKKIERSKIYQMHLNKLNEELQTYEADYASEKAKIDEMDRNLTEMESKKVEFDAEEKTKSKEHKRLLEEQADLKEKFQKFQQQDYYLNTKRKTTKEKLKTLKKQLEVDVKKLEELKTKTEQSQDNTELEQLEARIAEIGKEHKETESEMKNETEAAQKECEGLIKERDVLDKALLDFKAKQTDKLDDMNKANNALMLLQEQAAQARSKFQLLDSKLSKVKDDTVDKEAAIKRFEREIPEQTQKCEDLNQKLLQMQQRQQQQRETMQARRHELQELRSNAAKVQSRDRMENAVNAAISRGELKGIHGRLGSLGAIDKKYDVAISTAAGNLRNFVVDTLDDGVALTNFIKSHQLGIVTCIILEKLNPWTQNYRKTRNYPENVPRLFDLVTSKDDRFLPAFYFVLHDTLVAEDVDQASRVSVNGRERFRVVTLSGDMFESDGSMSGGGQPRRGLMGSSVTQTQVVDHRQIDQMEQEVEQMRAEVEQLGYQIDSTQRELVNLEKDITKMQENRQAYTLEVEQSAQRVENLRQNLQTAKSEMEKHENNPDIPVAEAEYEKTKKIYEKEEAKMKEQEEELSKYDEQIQEKLNSRLDPIKKKKKSLDKKLKEAQTKLQQIHTNRKTDELSLKKAEDSVTLNEAQKTELEEELEKVKVEVAELEVTAKETTDKYQEANEKCTSFEKEFGTIQRQVKELEEQMKQIKSEKLDLKHEIDKRFKVLHEKRQKAATYKAELDALVLDEVDFFDDEETNEDDEEQQEADEEEEVEDEEQEENKSNDDKMEVDDESQPQESQEEMEIDEQGEPKGDELDAEKVKSKKIKKVKKMKKRGPPKIPILTPEECKEVNVHQVEKTIERIEAELKKLTPNFAAIKEFEKKKADLAEKKSELSQIKETQEKYQKCLDECKKKRMDEFKVGFVAIARKLKELYRTITLGGDADLEYIDSLDPFQEGINFTVRPNKKSWKNNINLSGGEKTLSSLALIFALHYYKPSPLYIMDEIDAALDFKNVSIIANYIKQRTRNTQFLIISLRNNMYDLAEMLIGVYKTYNVSKSIAFDPIAFEMIMKSKQTTGLASSQVGSQPFKTQSHPVTTSELGGTKFNLIDDNAELNADHQVPSSQQSQPTTTIVPVRPSEELT